MASPVSVLLLVAVVALVGRAEEKESSVDKYDHAQQHHGYMQLDDLFKGKMLRTCRKTLEPCKNLGGKCTEKKNCDGIPKKIKKGCSRRKCICCLPKDCKSWSYPSKNWPYSCPEYCNGKSQSPIDIWGNCTGSVTEACFFNFSSSYSEPIQNITIKNNGHTVIANWSSSLPSRTISGCGLSGTYTLAQFHFHWGCKDNRGSEHTLYGTRYPMELHFVHYKTSYGNLKNALKYKDGLAVFGIFFILGAENPTIKPITDNLKYIKECYKNKTIDFNKALIDLIPTTSTFYRYNGSLTTPTCNEIVIWSVFSKPLSFSQHQVNQFRTLMCHKHEICDNYRGIQPLNGREVARYFPF